MAGQRELKNRNTFGATAFSTYGASWLSLATFVILDLAGALPASLNINNCLGWSIAGSAIFNTYMMLWSTRLNKAVPSVFATLEATEIVLFIGYFLAGAGHVAGTDLLHVGGYLGIVTAACAWYTSAAAVVNSMTERPVLKVGAPLWSGDLALRARPDKRAPGGYGQPVPQH